MHLKKVWIFTLLNCCLVASARPGFPHVWLTLNILVTPLCILWQTVKILMKCHCSLRKNWSSEKEIQQSFEIVTTQYIQCTIPCLLFQARWKNALLHIGLISTHLEIWTILWRTLSSLQLLLIYTLYYDLVDRTLKKESWDLWGLSWSTRTSGRNIKLSNTSQSGWTLFQRDWWLSQFQTWAPRSNLFWQPARRIHNILIFRTLWLLVWPLWKLQTR